AGKAHGAAARQPPAALHAERVMEGAGHPRERASPGVKQRDRGPAVVELMREVVVGVAEHAELGAERLAAVRSRAGANDAAGMTSTGDVLASNAIAADVSGGAAARVRLRLSLAGARLEDARHLPALDGGDGLLGRLKRAGVARVRSV